MSRTVSRPASRRAKSSRATHAPWLATLAMLAGACDGVVGGGPDSAGRQPLSSTETNGGTLVLSLPPYMTKDPGITLMTVNGAVQRVGFWGDYSDGGKTQAMSTNPAGPVVTATFPDRSLPAGQVRWGASPIVDVASGMLYLYFGQGDPNDPNSTFRIFVASASAARDLTWDASNALTAINFTSQTRLDVPAPVAGRPYGAIDAFPFVDGQARYLYYTAYVTDGSAFGGSYLRVARMSSYTTLTKPAQGNQVNYSGYVAPDWAVAEGARVIKDNGAYVLFLSSRDTNSRQQIVAYLDSTPLFTAKGDRVSVYSASASDRPWKLMSSWFETGGVGALYPWFENNQWNALYQGLETSTGDLRFRLGLVEIDPFVHGYTRHAEWRYEVNCSGNDLEGYPRVLTQVACLESCEFVRAKACTWRPSDSLCWAKASCDTPTTGVADVYSSTLWERARNCPGHDLASKAQVRASECYQFCKENEASWCTWRSDNSCWAKSSCEATWGDGTEISSRRVIP